MESFFYVLENLGERQMKVFKAFKEKQPCSNLMISKYLGLPINCITGRRLELQKLGLIRKQSERESNYTHRRVVYWNVPNWMMEVMLWDAQNVGFGNLMNFMEIKPVKNVDI